MLKFFSSGGLGDSLIVCIKALQQDIDAEIFHYEKHKCHKGEINDIINTFAKGKCIISKNPEISAKEACSREFGIYLNTKIVQKEMISPFIGKFKNKLRGFENSAKYICIQKVAGRLHDNTRREIDDNIIIELSKLMPHHDIIVLSPEKHNIKGGFNIINKTGKTKSVIDALSIIKNCDGFVGQDGICAYFAAMCNKPCIINYHMPNLVYHYWNDMWFHSGCVPLVGAGNLLKLEYCNNTINNFAKMVKINDR